VPPLAIGGGRVLGRTRSAPPARPALLATAIVLVAINLRASITAVGPIVSDIRADLGLSSASAGLLTTLPVLAFAVASPLAGPLSRRIGIERTLAGALVVLLGGILMRVAGTTWAALAGTALLGTAIAAGNVLLPSLVKRDLPKRIGPVTSLYVTVMVTFAGIASTVSVPLADDAGLGWRGALAIWAAPVAFGLVVWLPRAARSGPPEVSSRGEAEVQPTRMRRSAIAWQVTAYMGLQSFAFYVLVAWLPELLQDDGVSATTAGALVGAMQAASLVATIAVPVLATRTTDQRRLVLVSSVLGVFATAGLLVAPGDLALLWTVTVGVAGGSTLSLALAFFVLRTRDSADAALLSGMAQSLGYGFAAAGPFLIGALHDATDGWTVPAAVLLADWVLILVAGTAAGRRRVVAEPRRE
jgi:MFS transporter, CP family, cyanate transporter